MRHWRGELGLGTSFWGCGVLLSAGLALALAIAGHLRLVLAERSRSLDGVECPAVVGALGLAGALAALLALLVWQSVGAWRAAGRHPGRGGSRLWAFVARAAIAANVAATGAALSTGPAEVARAWRGSFPARLVPYAIRVSPDGGAVEFAGEIRRGAAAALDRELGGRGSGARTLRLSGLGGEVREALRMAGVMRRRGLAAEADGICVSACTIVYIAGADRRARRGARLGFHSARSARGDAPFAWGDIRLSLEAAELFDTAGIDPAFREGVEGVPSDRVWWPTPEELERAGVVLRWLD